MELCSHNHDEVCYEGRVCPVCTAIDEAAERENTLEEELKASQEKCEQYEEIISEIKPHHPEYFV